MRIFSVRIFFCFLVGSVLFVSGCADRPELSRSDYGIILEALPKIDEADEPFVFPVGADGNDHRDCKFSDLDMDF